MSALQIVGTVFAGLLGIILSYLVIVIFTPLVKEPKQSLPDTGDALPSIKPPEGIRQDIRFGENGEERAAWLYLLIGVVGPVPCVVMNNGLGGTKDIVVEPFALRFAAAGLAVLTYDYRHFGMSS